MALLALFVEHLLTQKKGKRLRAAEGLAALAGNRSTSVCQAAKGFDSAHLGMLLIQVSALYHVPERPSSSSSKAKTSDHCLYKCRPHSCISRLRPPWRRTWLEGLSLCTCKITLKSFAHVCVHVCAPSFKVSLCRAHAPCWSSWRTGAGVLGLFLPSRTPASSATAESDHMVAQVHVFFLL